MQSESERPNIMIAILAAGASRRFGSPKMLSKYRGKELISHSIDAASGVANAFILVVGREWQRITCAVAPAHPFFVLNENYSNGICSSIALAADACFARADAMLLMLADQPLVTATHLTSLTNAWSGADTHIVASTYDSVDGPPILFPRACRRELCALQGDTGARSVLKNSAYEVTSITFPDAAFDIDTPSDLERR